MTDDSQIDEDARRAFERLRANGQQVDLANYLPNRCRPCYAGTLLELVIIDLEYRWKESSRNGKQSPSVRPRVDDYLEQFPELQQPEIRNSLLDEERIIRGQFENSPGHSGNDFRVLPELNDYRIVREIGRGAMGVVYEAEQISLGRRVAVKVLPQQATDERSLSVERFEREARAAAKLHHTNIVPVFDVGIAGNSHYYVMQYISGVGLDVVLKRLRSEPNDHRPGFLLDRITPEATRPSTTEGTAHFHRQVAQLGIDIAEALNSAHSDGVLHRDIKPANLLIDESGTPWVTDFGLAKIDKETDLTRTGDVLGTLRYIAPEILQGRSDGRSDLCSLGLTLYELLALQPARPASDQLEVINRARDGLIPSLSSIDASIPRDLETIVHKTIDPDPDRRYQTGQKLADDLQRFLRDEPILARPATAVEKLKRWTRRNRVLAGSLTIGTLLLTVTAVGSIMAAARFNQLSKQKEIERARAVAQEDFAKKAQVVAENLSSERHRDLYVAEMNYASSAASQATGISRVRQLVDKWIPAPETRWEEDVRGWEWYYLKSLCHREFAVLDPGHSNVTDISWGTDGNIRTAHPGGGWLVQSELKTSASHSSHETGGRLIVAAWNNAHTMVAAGYRDCSVRIANDESGHVIAKLEAHETELTSVAWSADGQWLATTDRGGDGIIWDWQARKIHRRFEGSDWYQCREATWHPHQPYVLVAGRNAVRVISAETGEEISRGELSHRIQPAWSPDGHQYAVAQDAILEIRNASNHELIHKCTGHSAGISDIAWRSNGTVIGTGSSDGTVRTWNAKTGKPLDVFRGHDNEVQCLAWEPNGSRIASGGSFDKTRVWDSDMPHRDVTLAITPISASFDWNPAGTRIVYAENNRITVIEPERGDEIVRWTVDDLVNNVIASVRYSPDGKRLAVESQHADTRVIESETGKVLAQLSAGLDDPLDQYFADQFLSWSPDGKRLASISDRRQVTIWDTESMQSVKSPPPTERRVFSVAFNHDGSQIAYASGTKLYLWDVQAERISREIETSGWIYSLSWHPRKKALAVTSSRTFSIWDAANGKRLKDCSGPTRDILCVEWSPDGERIAAGTSDNAVFLWDAETGAVVASFPGYSGGVHEVHWSPDNVSLATASRRGSLRIANAQIGLDLSMRNTPTQSSQQALSTPYANR